MAAISKESRSCHCSNFASNSEAAAHFFVNNKKLLLAASEGRASYSLLLSKEVIMVHFRYALFISRRKKKKLVRRFESATYIHGGSYPSKVILINKFRSEKTTTQ